MTTYPIIPDLVQITTNLPKINDFLMSQDLSFYKKKTENCEFSYTVEVSKHIPFVPSNRLLGNYRVSKDEVYYSRPIIGTYGFSFVYDRRRRKFIFSPVYRYHNVNIGDIFTMGRHIFHMVEAELMLHGKFVILSAAVSLKGKTVIILAPYRHGKTTFVSDALRKGASYIAENFSVIDIHTSQLHGIAPVFSNKNRQSNKDLKAAFVAGASVIEKTPIEKIYLYYPDNPTASKEDIIHNYVATYAGFYAKNLFIRSVMYYDLLNGQADRQYRQLEEFLKDRVEVISDLQPLLG